ncbi:hypothetical protein CU254_15535 [Amycolatopsis sp. AA4]|uniref:hypothetical protein n=1 Tax=Actinomycetes TaxID=1760 RepID=UPI0001B5603A|nr:MULTISPECIES: hypothetical protein [Actinomycetes]ATY11716.1 hypothetical protein CU254_15535 [Amycolatopsis sp. AA4]EFL07377.1 predicted protein [Streptomyces sp. AA4]
MATEILSDGWDSPYYVVRTSAFDAKFLVGGGEKPDEVDNVDVTVHYPDRSRWSATVLTLDEVDRVMRRWESTGECAGGSYFAVPDGLIVREPGVRNMAAVLIAMHDGGELNSYLMRLADYD